MSRPETATPALPWWRVRMLWLVLGGPLAVVVASFVTLGLAISHPDPVLEPVPSSATGAAAGGAETPAVLARNHAATPPR